MRSGTVAVLTIGVAIMGYAWIARAQSNGNGNGNDKDIAPNGKGHYTLDHPENGNGNGQAGKGKPVAFPMTYHGGPVMTDPTNVYYIWYGAWDGGGSEAKTILGSFMRSLGGSPYFNINTTYYDSARHPVRNFVNLIAEAVDSSPKTSLSDDDIKTVVANAITSGQLPSDTNGVYFVLTSKEVNATSGFCTQYCGWHTHATIGNATIGYKDIKYSFVGNPERCPSACEAQTTSPNGNAGADGMASIIAHELSESVTDPDLNAWYDQRGYENADKCAWTFGSTYPAANNSRANVNLGGKDYLIQQNWVLNTGCAMRYPAQ